MFFVIKKLMFLLILSNNTKYYRSILCFGPIFYPLGVLTHALDKVKIRQYKSVKTHWERKK